MKKRLFLSFVRCAALLLLASGLHLTISRCHVAAQDSAPAGSCCADGCGASMPAATDLCAIPENSGDECCRYTAATFFIPAYALNKATVPPPGLLQLLLQPVDQGAARPVAQRVSKPGVPPFKGAPPPADIALLRVRRI